MAANSFWTDSRLSAQRPTARTLTLPSPSLEVGSDTVLEARAAVRRRDLSLPSWVVFCMTMLATFAVCVTVTMRTHAEMHSAESEEQQLSAEVEQVRGVNDSLKRDLERLRNDPNAREAAVRTRMNMLRANEIVVPLD